MMISFKNRNTDVVAELVLTGLRERFGVPGEPRRLNPLDELLLTILSQNTNDRNRDTAFRALENRFQCWEEILEVPVQELASVIAPAGLGPTKGRRIHDLLKQIYINGDRDLLNLCALPVEKAMEKLLSIKGVGPKTAACVLLFSCRQPVFPVDTHIYRIAGRLGMLPDGTDRVKAHSVLGSVFPREHYLELHLNLIRLGREVCRSHKPLCKECPMVDICPSAYKMAGLGKGE